MRARRLTLGLVPMLCVMVGGLFCGVSSAGAFYTHTFIREFNGSETPQGSQFVATPGGLAVNDTTEDVYVANREGSVVDVFSAEGKKYIGQLTESDGTTPYVFSPELRGIAVDQVTGAVYVLDDGGAGVVDVFNSSGVYQSQFGAGVMKPASTLAVDDSSEDIYVSGLEMVYVFSAAGELLATWTGENTPAKSFPSDTVVAVAQQSQQVYVGGGGENYKFTASGSYLSQLTEADGTTPFGGHSESAAVDTNGHVYSGNEERVSEFGREGSLVGELTGFERGAFGAGILGLATDATGQLFVAQENKVSVVGPDIALPPSIVSESFSDASATGATLHAEIDPSGLSTKYFIQYGTSESYGAASPAEPGVNVGDSAEVTSNVQVSLAGLSSGTVYHYRVVIESPDGTVYGHDQTFSTLTASVSGLPDGRVFELVSPVENQDADVFVPDSYDYEMSGLSEGFPTQEPFQASVDGDAVAYAGGANSSGNGYQVGPEAGNEYLAVRASGGGWSQTVLSPQGQKRANYEAFSSDLSTAVLGAGGIDLGASPPVPLAPLSSEAEMLAGYRVLYARNDADGSYRPLLTSRPPNRGPEEFAASGVPAENPKVETSLGYAGGVDQGQFLFEANDALTANADPSTPASENNLYDSIDGHLSLVNVLPDGSTEPGATFGLQREDSQGEQTVDFSHVISEDGQRVFWTDLHPGPNERHIFVSENVGTPEQVSREIGMGQYLTASSDGSRVFFRHEGELYERGLTSEQTVDLTPGVELAQGFVGASDDGSYLYYVSEKEEKDDLYVLHDGGDGWESPRLIAGLAYSDGTEIRPFSTEENGQLRPAGDWEWDTGRRTAEVSPDGKSLVFMSNKSLTGYDSGGAVEVYVYEAEGAGSLFCVSCSPSNEPIASAAFGAAAFLPVGWGNTDEPRWMSADGDRVFFDATVPLVPAASDGKQNVYEWERDGTGSCHEESNADGGCIYLLSGGGSESASWLVSEDVTGENVFIATRADLVSGDKNETFALYDARVDGLEEAPVSVCSGTGCQGLPSPPPTFATPASVTFEGVGNFPAIPVSSTVKKNAKRPSGGLLTAAQRQKMQLRVCRRDRVKQRRRACERRVLAHSGKNARSQGRLNSDGGRVATRRGK
jgi:DNA-binding beta-propeller fold protein YncE